MYVKNSRILKLGQFVLCVILLSGLISLCTSEENKISKLFERIETAFFVNNSNELNNMRETFFPSTLSHYWQADGIEIIDIDFCLKKTNISSLYSCSNLYDQKEHRTTIDKKEDITECWVFRWTNSYLLNLIDMKQLLHFEHVTTSALFGTIAKNYGKRLINLTFNLPCDELLSSMDDRMIQQSLIRFLSWVSHFKYTLLVF